MTPPLTFHPTRAAAAVPWLLLIATASLLPPHAGCSSLLAPSSTPHAHALLRGPHAIAEHGRRALERTRLTLTNTHNKLLVAAADRLHPPPKWQKTLKTALSVGVCALGARRFGAAWGAQRAGEKFRAKAGLYLTIPVIAGVLNWATNKLAVWMIFNPEEFAGIPLISRPIPNNPLGVFGWQGIVPAKVRKMGSDIVDMTINELLDVKAVFGRMQPDKVADLMAQGGLLTALADAAEETHTLPRTLIDEARNREGGGEATITGSVLARQARRVVRDVVRRVSKDPLRYCALKRSVVDDMAARKMLICELFQRCGRDELRFIVDVGLWGGGLLGLAQMALWLVFTPKWSLVAGGALVGYVTDWVALKVMFEPVDVWRPKWLADAAARVGIDWKGFQGLFLTRQDAVSEEFSSFMAENILTPPKIWNALLAPQTEEPSCEEEQMFEDLLVTTLMREAGPFIQGGKDGAVRLARALRPRLAPVVASTHVYVAKQMALEGELRRAMKKMDSARFENVLHPIFQEDELTLIAVGAVLGGLAGYGQTFFY